MINLINLFKNLSSFVLVILGIFLGVRATKNKQAKDTLENVKIARKIEQENDKLTRDELIDKL